MGVRVVTHAERPDLEDRWEVVVGPAWPEFMLHDAVCNAHWWQLAEHFPEFQLYVVQDETDDLIGWGNTIPIGWNGTVEGLPRGVDEVLLAGIRLREQGVSPTTLSGLRAVVRPDRQGAGLSATIMRAMRDTATRHGFPELLAPVRPLLKDRYPLIPMDRYVNWTRRDDGLPFDPFLRVHVRLGATLMKVAPESMVIEGAVPEWEEWTGMAFPESGRYVVPGALEQVSIDREQDVGRYVEPNVWMLHPLGPA